MFAFFIIYMKVSEYVEADKLRHIILVSFLILAGLVLVAVRYCKGRKGLPLSCRIAFLGACAYFLSSLVGVAMFYTTPFFFIFMGMADSARGEHTELRILHQP